ncbi:MAG: methylmalonyl-CoA mutase family protein [Chloroflexota bacterium]
MAIEKAVRKAKRPGAKNTAIATALQEWEAKVRQPSTVSKPERKQQFKTMADYPVKPLYTPLDVADIDYLKEIGFPGQYPFTRGDLPNGYRSHDFELWFYSGFGTPESGNKRFKELLARGARRVAAASDLPTQIALDPDHPLAKGEVGRVGVSIPSLDDSDRLYGGINIAKNGASAGVCNCIPFYPLALSIALAEKRGIKLTDMVNIGAGQNDPLKEYTGRDTWVFPVPIAIELATDNREYVLRNLPRLKNPRQTGMLCTTQLGWCGVGAAEELGFALAHFVCYIDSALRRGLAIEEFLPQIDWHAGCDMDIFQEAAKFRAGRKLFARLVKERYHCDNPEVQRLRCTTWIHSQRMTAQQPLNNLARLTMTVLSGYLGGLEGISTPGWDEAIALPTEESTRISNMIKFIINHECGLEGVIDPLGGSYYVERLTRQIEEEADYWFNRIQDMGGAVAAVQKGFHYQEELKGTYRERQQINSGERVVIGLNKFQIKDEKMPEIFPGADPEDEQRQVENIQKLRETRNKALAKEKLARLEEAAIKKTKDDKFNIVPAVLEAVKAYATVGEIGAVLRKVFGEYKPAQS